MTQEEKAKRYDEAIQRAMSIYNDKSSSCEAEIICENIFPELKESEDERIKRCIIDTLKNYHHLISTGGVTKEDMLAWLEKQSEQKPAWSEEDKVMLDEIIDFFENGTVKLQHDLSLYASWLKSLRPKSTWKPSEEQIEALESATENCAYSEYQDCLRELIFQLKKLREE